MKIILLSLFLLFCPLTLAAQDQNIPYFDGVPLMNGFQISQDDTMIFDKPSGRIIEAFTWCEAQCPSIDAIHAYYAQSLSSLGWTPLSATHFTKNEHALSLDIQRDPEGSSTAILFQSNS